MRAFASLRRFSRRRGGTGRARPLLGDWRGDLQPRFPQRLLRLREPLAHDLQFALGDQVHAVVRLRAAARFLQLLAQRPLLVALLAQRSLRLLEGLLQGLPALLGFTKLPVVGRLGARRRRGLLRDRLRPLQLGAQRDDLGGRGCRILARLLLGCMSFLDETARVQQVLLQLRLAHAALGHHLLLAALAQLVELFPQLEDLRRARRSRSLGVARLGPCLVPSLPRGVGLRLEPRDRLGGRASLQMEHDREDD